VDLRLTSNEAYGPAPPRPCGLGLFGLLASLLAPYRSMKDMLWCQCGSTSRLASKPNSLQQNRKLFLSGPLVRWLCQRKERDVYAASAWHNPWDLAEFPARREASATHG
jgi:hypothetical protein